MKEVYLKYNNMYISDIGTYEKYPENEFIERISFDCHKECANEYYYDKIPFMIQKLCSIGFDKCLFYTEEIEENEEDN